MNLEELILKYISSAEYAFSNLTVTEGAVKVEAETIRDVLVLAKAYLTDAKYYRAAEKFEVSLASIAYCEGLIDALKLIGAVTFEWPVKRQEKEE